jgi:hypothetical protein
MRSPLGSVSARIAAEVPCTATVVRPSRVALQAGAGGNDKAPDDQAANETAVTPSGLF